MKRVLLCTVGLSMLLCACSDNASTGAADSDSTVQTANDSTASQNSEPSNSEVSGGNFDLLEHIEATPSIALLYEMSEHKVLICTEQDKAYSVYTVDTESGARSEAIICDMIPQCEKNGFWTLTVSDSPDAMIIQQSWLPNLSFSEAKVYDYDMKEMETISLPNGINAVGFDIDIASERLVYSATELADENTYVDRLIMTDLAFENAEIICETPLPQASVLLGLDTLHICEDEIIFLGGYIPKPEAQSVRAYGSLPFDTGVPEYVYRSDTCGFALASYENGAYVYESDYPSGAVSSGQCIKKQDGQTTALTLQNTMESLNVYASENGAYFATAMTGNNEDGSVIIRISVYASNGELVNTFDTSFAVGESQNVHAVYVLEEAHTVYMKTLSAGTGEHWYQFEF